MKPMAIVFYTDILLLVFRRQHLDEGKAVDMIDDVNNITL